MKYNIFIIALDLVLGIVFIYLLKSNDRKTRGRATYTTDIDKPLDQQDYKINACLLNAER